jgi:hypothetical protein
MKRQELRRIEHEWRKVKCHRVFDLAVSMSMFPKFRNGMLDFFVKVDDSVAVRYVLSYYLVWFGMIYHIEKGIPHLIYFWKIGVASDAWINDYFEEPFEDFVF